MGRTAIWQGGDAGLAKPVAARTFCNSKALRILRHGFAHGILSTRDALLAVLNIQESDMVARYYGISRGEQRITEGAATTGKEVELAIPVIGNVTKLDLIIFLDRIRDHLITGTENFEA